MTIDVMFTRTNDGDYIAHFDCNESKLPSSGVFFYVAIKADELALLRHRAAKLQAEATQYNSNAMRFESERNTAIDCAEDYKAIIAQMKSEYKAQIEQLRAELATVKDERDAAINAAQCASNFLSFDHAGTGEQLKAFLFVKDQLLKVLP